MSGVAIIRYLLANNANLIAVVPAARIMSGVIPINSALPAISVMQISGVQHNMLGMASTTRLIKERAQITVMCADYPATKSIFSLIKSALPVSGGTVNGFACDSVIPESQGPDFYDQETNIYMQSYDYIVNYVS
jgi:hypothetical protein